MDCITNTCNERCEFCIDKEHKIEDFLLTMYSKCTHSNSRCSYYRAPEYLCDPCRKQGLELRNLINLNCRSRN